VTHPADCASPSTVQLQLNTSVEGDLSVEGQLTVNGGVTQVTGDLDVGGDHNVGGDLGVAGSLDVTTLTASSTARLAPLLTREANATYVWFARRGRRSAIVELHERRGGGAGVRVLLRSGDTSRVDATAGVETAAFDEEVASLHGVPRPSLALLALHHMLTRGGCSAVRLFTGTADCSQNCSSHDKPSLSTTGQSRPPLEPLACDAGLAAMDLLGPLGNESFVFLDLREYVSKLILRESSLEPARGESHGHQKLMGHRNGGTPAVRG